MDVTPQLLKEVEFREKFRGYDPDEVDDFLERVGVALSQLHDRLRESETHIETANARAARSEARVRDNSDMDETLRRTLVLAQRTADAAIKEAEEQAAAIVGEAQTKARQQLATADERSQQSIAGADTEAKRRLAGADEQVQRAVGEAQNQADQTVASAREQANRLLMDARRQAEEIVAQARSSADVVAEERRQQLLKDVAELEARREAVGRNATVLDAHLAKQRERLQGLSTDIASLIERGDRLGDLAPPDLVPEPAATVSVTDAPAPVPETEALRDEAAVATPPPSTDAKSSAEPEPDEAAAAGAPEAEASPAEQVQAAAPPFRGRATGGRVDPPLSPANLGAADDGGPPTEQIDIGDLLAGPPTPEPAAVAADVVDQAKDHAQPVENLDDTSPTPTPVPVDVDEPVPAPPPAFRSEGDSSAPPPPPPPSHGVMERSPSDGPGEPPQPPPPPRSPLAPRGVTQAAGAAASADSVVPDPIVDAAGAGLAAPGSLAARARNLAAPTPPPPARESFVDELRRAIGDDANDASEDTDFFSGADPSDGAEGLFEEGSDKARSWFGRRG